MTCQRCALEESDKGVLDPERFEEKESMKTGG